MVKIFTISRVTWQEHQNSTIICEIEVMTNIEIAQEEYQVFPGYQRFQELMLVTKVIYQPFVTIFIDLSIKIAQKRRMEIQITLQ